MGGNRCHNFFHEIIDEIYLIIVCVCEGKQKIEKLGQEFDWLMMFICLSQGVPTTLEFQQTTPVYFSSLRVLGVTN